MANALVSPLLRPLAQDGFELREEDGREVGVGELVLEVVASGGEVARGITYEELVGCGTHRQRCNARMLAETLIEISVGHSAFYSC